MAQRGRPRKTEVVEKKALTKAQIATLREMEDTLGDIRRKLFQMEDNTYTLSKAMFNIGMLYKTADDLENKMGDFLEEIDPQKYRFEF